MTSDDLWLWYLTFDLINIQRNPYWVFDPSLVVIELQLYKGDPNNNKPNQTETYIPTEGICYRNIPYCFSSQGDKRRSLCAFPVKAAISASQNSTNLMHITISLHQLSEFDAMVYFGNKIKTTNIQPIWKLIYSCPRTTGSHRWSKSNLCFVCHCLIGRMWGTNDRQCLYHSCLIFFPCTPQSGYIFVPLNIQIYTKSTTFPL